MSSVAGFDSSTDVHKPGSMLLASEKETSKPVQGITISKKEYEELLEDKKLICNFVSGYAFMLDFAHNKKKLTFALTFDVDGVYIYRRENPKTDSTSDVMHEFYAWVKRLPKTTLLKTAIPQDCNEIVVKMEKSKYVFSHTELSEVIHNCKLAAVNENLGDEDEEDDDEEEIDDDSENDTDEDDDDFSEEEIKPKKKKKAEVSKPDPKKKKRVDSSDEEEEEEERPKPKKAHKPVEEEPKKKKIKRIEIDKDSDDEVYKLDDD